MDQQEYIDELIIKCLSGEAGVDEIGRAHV